MRRIQFLLGACLLFGAAGAQEVLVPLTYVGGEDRTSVRERNSSVQAAGDTLVVPTGGFRDNFMYDSHRPDTTMWDLTLNPGVYVNRGWATAPLNLGVCTFDGIDASGYPYQPTASVNSSAVCDVLTSRVFDLSGFDVSDSVNIAFYWEAQGRGYAPNQVDSLQLQVNIPAWNTSGEVWKTVWFKEGYNPSGNDTSFHFARFTLDSTSYFTNGFRFRFRNYASACGSNDHWHIDEVWLKPMWSVTDSIIDDVFFVYDMPSLLRDYHQVPGDHYTSTSMASNVNVYIRNNDAIIRNVTYSYEIFEPGIPTPLYTYAGGADGTLQPFTAAGYSSFPAHATPPVNYQYTPFTSPDTGYYYVNHMLKKGTAANSPIDTVTYYQRMYNTYAYDEGTAEVGYGLLGPGSLLAYRFDMPASVTDTLTAIQMYFLPVLDIPNLEQREFRLTVWNHNGASNGPGSIIYQQQNANPYYAPNVPNRFHTYTLDSGIVVVSGTFYVGWQQEGPDRLYIGMDLENNQSDKIYYNTSGVWYTSVYPGALMMRPVFGEPYDVSGVNESEANSSIRIFPNPATESVTIADLEPTMQYTATIVDVSGREVLHQRVTMQDATLDVSTLTPGMYILNVTDENGIRTGVQRLVVE